MKSFYKIFLNLIVMLPFLFLAACSGYVDDDVTEGTDDGKEETIDPADLPKFVKHICIMEFTGQWCAMCPGGYQILHYAVNGGKYDPSPYKDITHIIALHDNSSGTDEFAEPLQSVQRQIFNEFKLGGYPASVIDLREGVMLTGGNSGLLEDAIKESVDEYPAHCGVAVKSQYDAAGRTAKIEAKLYSAKTDNYRLAVFVVEDGIVASQNDGGMTRKDYTHHHVARQMLSQSYKGDSAGELKAGKEITKSYTLNVDSAWNTAKTSIYVLAINGNDQINNVAVCSLDGGNTGYDYAETAN